MVLEMDTDGSKDENKPTAGLKERKTDGTEGGVVEMRFVEADCWWIERNIESSREGGRHHTGDTQTNLNAFPQTSEQGAKVYLLHKLLK